MEQPIPRSNEVVVVDLHMPFLSMVVFMVKWAIAAIPAILILALVGFMVFAIAGGIGEALMSQKASAPRYEPAPLPPRSSLGWKPHPTDAGLECREDDPTYCRLAR